MGFLSSVKCSIKLNPRRGLWESLIYHQSVSSIDTNLPLQLASEMEGSLRVLSSLSDAMSS